MITQDHTILSWVEGYKINFSKPVKQQYLPDVSNYNDSERVHFLEEINHLLHIGAISLCEPCIGQYISKIFLLPKSNGTKRLILNLKSLNKNIDTNHFKLEDLRTALKLMSKDCYMSTIDLKEAYYLIKIHPSSRKYLRFIYEHKIYEFNVLPFGLNTAPYLFTKLMKPVMRLLRLAGLTSTIYLDDLWLMANSFNECSYNINTSIKLLQSLGFIINFQKSNTIPSKSCKFLGFILNSHKFIITLHEAKIRYIIDSIIEFMKLKRCKIQKFAQIIGLLVSACPAVEYGWVYTKEFERYKYLKLKDDCDYNKYMNIPKSLHNDFTWWLKALVNPSHRIRDDNYALEIFSDASTTGWGGAYAGETASGQWSQEERAHHINYLELLAAFFSLKIFAKDNHDCQILLRIDNTTAISYINRMGGVQYPHLTNLTKCIWQWCESRKIFIFAYYIKSSENVVADKESRRVHPDIEWSLTDDAFRRITDTFGIPEIDLFASRVNKKCLHYVSWHRDPDAYAINAFTIDWSEHYFYAFPPFSIILKTCRKIITDKSKGIIIVPMWPTQPWFPLFSKLLVSDMIYFKAADNVIISTSSSHIQQGLTLVAGVLSGVRYYENKFR